MTRRARNSPPAARAGGVSDLDHILALLDQMELRYQQRYDAQTKAVETAMTAQQTAMRTALDASDKSVAAAMAAAEKGVTKAEVAADKRFDLLNELRIGVATKDELMALEKVVNSIREEVTGMRQRGVGVSATWAMMLGLGGLILTIVGVAVAIVVASN